jgi:RNA polymerase sigma-70 factor, ECF subfamily
MTDSREEKVSSEAAIIEPAIQTSDSQAAFTHLLASEAGTFFRLARRLVGDDEAARDLVQDGLLRAHLSLKNFRWECSLKNWVIKIIVNQGLKKLRRRKLKKKVAGWFQLDKESAPSGPAAWGANLAVNPEKAAALKEQAQALHLALEKLSARQRTVVVLRYLQQMSIAEISEVTGIGPGTVKTHLVRALRQIRASGANFSSEVSDESL